MGFNLGITKRPIEDHELHDEVAGDPALERKLEGDAPLQGVRWVPLIIIDPRLDDPLLVQSREAARLIVQLGDEVVGAVRPQLQIIEGDLLIGQQLDDVPQHLGVLLPRGLLLLYGL